VDQQLLSFHLTADFIALTWNGEKTRKEISNICQLSIPNRPIIAKVGREDWKMEKNDDKKRSGKICRRFLAGISISYSHQKQVQTVSR
jgi:hypothetical protein